MLVRENVAGRGADAGLFCVRDVVCWQRDLQYRKSTRRWGGAAGLGYAGPGAEVLHWGLRGRTIEPVGGERDWGHLKAGVKAPKGVRWRNTERGRLWTEAEIDLSVVACGNFVCMRNVARVVTLCKITASLLLLLSPHSAARG